MLSHEAKMGSVRVKPVSELSVLGPLHGTSNTAAVPCKRSPLVAIDS